ncbi:hypothetical protein DFH09DRAFT_1110647 [Mycena vulgaris]|nr:hypothetical protein DFH09DRAFT_1110647 [Mycena vulgaris]
MSFWALSVVLSASEDRLPRQHLAVLAKCLGLSADPTASRIDLMSELGTRRRRIVSEHSNVHTARLLFEQIETLPKGSLLTVARSHGLDLRGHHTRDTLRAAIWKHVGTGACILREGHASHLACSSVSSQFNSGPGGGIEDPSIQMQVRILRQLGPVLKTNPV